MTDPHPHPDPDATPRWVKVFTVIAVAVVVLFAVLLLTGRGGDHGPGRHSSGSADHTALRP